MACEYFLPLRWLFPLPYRSLFIWYGPTRLFFFSLPVLLVSGPKILLLRPMSWAFSLWLHLAALVSSLAYKSSVYLELTFVCDVRSGSKFILLLAFSQNCLSRRWAFFHRGFLATPSEISCPCLHGFPPGLSVLFQPNVSLRPSPYRLDHYGF